MRRMPVVNESGSLQGILTMDDILELLAEELMDVVALVPASGRRKRSNAHERHTRNTRVGKRLRSDPFFS